MTVKGKVVLDDKGLPGAKVILSKNGLKVDETLTNSSGKYMFTEMAISPEGDIYIIQISKPGHITVKHWVSTKAPDDRKVIFPDYEPEVELFKAVKEVQREKALSDILDKPISKFGYSVSKGDFADDRAYFSTIKARVNQLFEILDAEERERKRLLAEYRTKQLEEENKLAEEKEAEKEKSSFELKFEEAVAKADKSFEKKKYRKAMAQYKDVMGLVSKSGMIKAERDKLKKHSKRQIYDLETLMAGLSEEELDELEKEEEVVVESEKETSEEETSDAVADADPEEELEEVVEEPLSEREIAKNAAEESMTNALAELDKIKEEKKEEIAQKRQENKEIAATKTMVSNVEVKKYEVAVSVEKKEAEAKVNKNKEVVAMRNQAMVTMLANSKKKTAAAKKEAAPSEAREERSTITPKVSRPTVLRSTTAADKDKKTLKRSVVIVHNRIKVKNTQAKPAATEKAATKKAVAKEQTFKPRSFQYIEESYYKTVTNTVIKYPVRQDTLQHVDYLWGADYYYKNTVEIDEDTYNRVLNGIK